MKHFYRDVPHLGNVAVSRHAQACLLEENISEQMFEKVLLKPTKQDIPDGQNILWREQEGVRLVIIFKPEPDVGAKLIKTIYRIQRQAIAGQ